MNPRERFRRWLSPELVIPFVRPPELAYRHGPWQNETVALPQLPGRTRSGEVLVVTDRGVEIPIGKAQGWTVEDFIGVLAWINGLPELEPGSRRT